MIDARGGGEVRRRGLNTPARTRFHACVYEDALPNTGSTGRREHSNALTPRKGQERFEHDTNPVVLSPFRKRGDPMGIGVEPTREGP